MPAPENLYLPIRRVYATIYLSILWRGMRLRIAEVEIMYKETIKDAGIRMDKTIANIQNDLATLRAGRANPKILDKITVDYYGTPTALNQVGNISSPEPRLLVIAPWEPKMRKR